MSCFYWLVFVNIGHVIFRSLWSKYRFQGWYGSPNVLECSWIWKFYLGTIKCSWIDGSVLGCPWKHKFFVTIYVTHIPVMPAANDFVLVEFFLNYFTLIILEILLNGRMLSTNNLINERFGWNHHNVVNTRHSSPFLWRPSLFFKEACLIFAVCRKCSRKVLFSPPMNVLKFYFQFLYEHGRRERPLLLRHASADVFVLRWFLRAGRLHLWAVSGTRRRRTAAGTDGRWTTNLLGSPHGRMVMGPATRYVTTRLKGWYMRWNSFWVKIGDLKIVSQNTG